jgi:hypothetical protein
LLLRKGEPGYPQDGHRKSKHRGLRTGVLREVFQSGVSKSNPCQTIEKTQVSESTPTRLSSCPRSGSPSPSAC